MGPCQSSKASPPVQAQAVQAQVVSGGGSGARKRKPIKKDAMFQWRDGSGWNNYDKQSDARLKQAYLVGYPSAKFELKNQSGKKEQYSFRFSHGKMSQMNVQTGKPRDMRPAWGMYPPKGGMLPQGDMIVITLTQAHAGKDTIEVPNPRDKGKMIKVSLPKKARAGQKIAIPIPGNGETVDQVAARQQAHNNGVSTGAKAAVGMGVVAAAGAGVVGGVILGDHLAGGTLAQDVAGDVADWTGDAVDDIADFAVDAADDIGDFAEDVGDWLGDAGEDVGDWVCSIFD